MTFADLSSSQEIRAGSSGLGAKLHADFWVGVFFAAIGAVVTEQGAALRKGSAANMGPGFVPLWIGIALIVVGCLIALLALRQQISTEEEGRKAVFELSAVQPIVVTTAALLAFSVSLETWGLFLASGLLVAIARLDAWLRRPFEIVALAFVLSAFNIAIFHFGLGMPVSIWPVSIWST
jgi:hypothetical protein